MADLFVSFAASYSLESKGNPESYDALEPYLRSDDWFVKHRAKSLDLAMISGSEANANIALEVANDSMDLIPEGMSDYIVEAKSLSLENIAFLHNLLKNTELAIENTIQLIELQQTNEANVDGWAIITNMIYSFSAWRDFETAADLSEILLRLEQRTDVTIAGLTEMRISRIHNDLRNYDKGLEFSELAISKAVYDPVKLEAELSRIISLAGLARIDEAQTELDNYLSKIPEDRLQRPATQNRIDHAKMLIALNSGNALSAEKLFNHRLSNSIRQVLQTANQSTNEMLAELQNTQDRQAEREAALARESELQKEALDKQAQSNRLLTVLLAVLSAAAIAALAFARFRSKVAKKLKISAELAEAGEKSKSEFLALMSHELRTPLNGIIGLADFLADQAPTPDLREKNAVILNSGHELLSLVENILDMTLIEAGEMKSFPEPTVLRPLLEECISNWKQSIERKGIAYTAHIDPSVPDIMTVDPKRLMQCINNLLSNAAKFTSKGRVHVHILGKDLKDNQAELQVIVADTGVGITEAAQGRMFQAFVQADTSMTRHYGGAGLGLAITKIWPNIWAAMLPLHRKTDGDLNSS